MTPRFLRAPCTSFCDLLPVRLSLNSLLLTQLLSLCCFGPAVDHCDGRQTKLWKSYSMQHYLIISTLTVFTVLGLLSCLISTVMPDSIVSQRHSHKKHLAGPRYKISFEICLGTFYCYHNLWHLATIKSCNCVLPGLSSVVLKAAQHPEARCSSAYLPWAAWFKRLSPILPTRMGQVWSALTHHNPFYSQWEEPLPRKYQYLVPSSI